MDPPIDQRSMLHCYIQEVSHITECTYTHDRLTTLPIDIDACYTITPSPCELTIDPCYTVTPSPCQLPIDPCNTLTPHKSHQTWQIYPRELLHMKDLLPMRVTI